MTVYVDDMKAKFGRMIMCHMIADDPEELREMARKIGVPVEWVQYPNTYKEHFDIALSKRAAAVAAGAREITWRESSAMVQHRRSFGVLGAPEAALAWRRRQLERRGDA